MAHYELHHATGGLASPFLFDTLGEALKHGRELMAAFPRLKLDVIEAQTVRVEKVWGRVAAGPFKR